MGYSHLYSKYLAHDKPYDCEVTQNRCINLPLGFGDCEHCRVGSLKNDNIEKEKQINILNKQKNEAYDFIKKRVDNIYQNCNPEENMFECDCWENQCPDSDNVSCDLIDEYRAGKKILES